MYLARRGPALMAMPLARTYAILPIPRSPIRAPNGGAKTVATIADSTIDRSNSATLIKVDSLRELIGNKISLPQLVVVGDQSSGKSSVLEGITGFAFPRDAELCTRYATQITCRREDYESVKVTVIPHEDADPKLAAELRRFSRTLSKAAQMDNEMLGQIFKDVNKELGISSGSAPEDDKPAGIGNAFSQHLMKIEICSPEQQHFTVIDVPGIFRKETSGVTTEADILLVRNMVMRYMRDPRTIILAIVPANVDPATQEILKLSREVDPKMERTMGVLTKPDLAIEKAVQKVAIDHVTGKRSDLTLGYYIVKNRGSDDGHMSLEEGLDAEAAFFSNEPWSEINDTGRAGIRALKVKVRALLTELVKREFSQLRTEVIGKIASLEAQKLALGPHRSDSSAQRAYLGGICEQVQSITRDALLANYAGNPDFFAVREHRLITRIVELDEQFSTAIREQGHHRAFLKEEEEEGGEKDSPSSKAAARSRTSGLTAAEMFPMISKMQSSCPGAVSAARGFLETVKVTDGNIMGAIRDAYNNSRGADLGTFNGTVLATAFQEQTRNWAPITKAYVALAGGLVASFSRGAIAWACADARVRSEVHANLVQDRLGECSARADGHADSLLRMERRDPSFTLNHYFNENLCRLQGERLAAAVRKAAGKSTAKGGEPALTLTAAQLAAVAGRSSQGNREQMHDYIYDVLRSYYKVAMKRYVDNVCLHVVHHDMLFSDDSPLYVLTPSLVHGLDDDQLGQYAGEDDSARLRREKLDRDVGSFKKALKVLKGTPSVSE